MYLRSVSTKSENLRSLITRNYKNYSKEIFKSDLKTVQWDSLLRINDLTNAWNKFKELLIACVNKHAPVIEKTISGRECPWLTSEIKGKIKERDYYLKKARKSKSEIDWSTYRRMRNSVTMMIRKSKANYHRSLFKESVKSPKDFWSKIKKLFPVKAKNVQPTSLKIGGISNTNKQEISNALCSYFTHIASSLRGICDDLVNNIWTKYSYPGLSDKVNPEGKVLTFSEVRPNDVLIVIKGLNSKKAAGYDNIPPRMIKDGAEELAVPVCHLINLSLRSSLFPTSEKLAKISPVPKSNDRSLLDNFRPISILSVFSKVLETIVYHQISNYLEENNLLSPYQFGFRRGRSTTHAVTYLTDNIRENIDKGLCTGAIYMDLRKAFDVVHHANLLGKLPSYGIKNKELLWFQDYLFNRSQFVSYDGCNSNTEKIISGVPQGSILGPLLFALLINDIHLKLNNTSILLYADDTVIYYADKSAREVKTVLNKEVNFIATWFDENNLILNLKKGKTEFVLYGQGRI